MLVYYASERAVDRVIDRVRPIDLVEPRAQRFDRRGALFARNEVDRVEQTRLHALTEQLSTCSGNVAEPPEITAAFGGPPANPCW